MIDNTIPQVTSLALFRPDNSGFYVNAFKQLESARTILVKESSRYGGVIWLELTNGNLIQLSKKKISWSALNSILFDSWDNKDKRLKQLKMHGMATIERVDQ